MGRRAESAPGRLGRWGGSLSFAGRVPRAWLGLAGAGARRGGSRCPAASGADWFADRGPGSWAVVAGSVAGMPPGRGPGSNFVWGYDGALLARGSGVSCCVARGVPRVLRVAVVPVLPVSVRGR